MESARRRGIPAFAVDRAAEAFVAAPPARVRDALAAEPARVLGRLRVQLTADRGEKGWRWRVTDPFPGSAELFLRVDADGCRVHVFLRSEESGTAGTLDRAMTVIRQRLFELKDAVEDGRAAGTAPGG